VIEKGKKKQNFDDPFPREHRRAERRRRASDVFGFMLKEAVSWLLSVPEEKF